MNENQENPPASSVKMYKLFVNNTEYGPYAEEQLHQMVSNGQVSADTMVWTAGMSTWTPYRDAFSAPVHPAAAPVPPPPAAAPVPPAGAPVPPPLAAAPAPPAAAAPAAQATVQNKLRSAASNLTDKAEKLKEKCKTLKGNQKTIIAAAGAVAVLVIGGVVVNSWLTASQAEKDFNKGIYYIINDSDENAALPYIRDAAKAGHMNAMYMYAEWLRSEGNVSQAVEWYEKAADKGHILATVELCDATYKGKGMKADEEKAIKLAKKLYKKGAPQFGSDKLFSLVAKELDLPVEIVSAIKHNSRASSGTLAKLKKLADDGDGMAAYLYARAYDVKENEKEKYLTKAASKGHIAAKAELLRLYMANDRDKEALEIYKELNDNGCLEPDGMKGYLKLKEKLESNR